MPTTPATEPKPDNLFGICAALGEDVGFDPLWLRVALGAGILWNPLAMLAIYGALGLLVVVTRMLAPTPRRPIADRPLAPAANEDTPEIALAA